MSSFPLTAIAGMSQRAFDGAVGMADSQTAETTVQFGDGAHGAALPCPPGPGPVEVYAEGAGASGNAATVAPRQADLLVRLSVAFDAVPHYGAVLMQQGRVLTDADHNEAAEVHPGQQPVSDVSDAVAVAFDHGHMRRPVVMAPLWSVGDKPPVSDDASGAADSQGVQSHLDSMSEMGETESLRLQMAMDRLSKMMSTLSNLMQRIETTNFSVTQNIK